MSQFSGRSLHVAAILVLLLVPLLFFWDMVILGHEPLAADTQAVKPLGHWATDAHGELGEVPLWCPGIFAGMPSYGSFIYTPTSPLNLVRNVRLALGENRGARYFLSIVVGALSLYFWMVWRRRHPLAALGGALIFIMTPYFLGLVWAGHSTKLHALYLAPAVFFALDAFLARRTLAMAILLAAAIAMQLWCNHPQISYYTLFLGALYAGGVLLFDRPPTWRGRRWLGGLALGVLALTIAAALMLEPYAAVLEYAPHSIRGSTSVLSDSAADGDGATGGAGSTGAESGGAGSGGAESGGAGSGGAGSGGAGSGGDASGGGLDWSYATAWSYPPQEIICFLFPAVYGLQGKPYWGELTFTQSTHYFGATVLVLMAVGLLLSGGRRRWVWLALMGVTLLIGFGRYFPVLYGPMYHGLPMFDRFRVPSMIYSFLPLFAAVLAADGLQGILAWMPQGKSLTKVGVSTAKPPSNSSGSKASAAKGSGSKASAANSPGSKASAAKGPGSKVSAAKGPGSKVSAAKGPGSKASAAKGPGSKASAAKGSGSKASAAKGSGSKASAANSSGSKASAARSSVSRKPVPVSPGSSPAPTASAALTQAWLPITLILGTLLVLWVLFGGVVTDSLRSGGAFLHAHNVADLGPHADRVLEALRTRPMEQLLTSSPLPSSLVAFVAQRMEMLRSSVTVGLGLLFVTALVIEGRRRQWYGGTVAVVLLVGLVTVDLWTTDRKFYEVYPRSVSEAVLVPDGVVRFLQGEPGEFRVAPFVQVRGNPHVFSSNHYTAFGLESIGGYQPAKLRIYDDLIQSGAVSTPAVFSMLGARYIIAAADLSGAGLPVVYEQPFSEEHTVYVHRNPAALPRAYFVTRLERHADGRAVLDALKSPAFDPSVAALVPRHAYSALADRFSPGVVEEAEFGLHQQRLRVRVEGPESGLLVLSEIFYEPGWRARIGGAEAPLLRVNHVLRALEVPPGEHEIVLQAVSPAYRAGLWVSRTTGVLCLVVLLGLLWRTRLRRRQGAPGD